jgi:hypothetical protein
MPEPMLYSFGKVKYLSDGEYVGKGVGRMAGGEKWTRLTPTFPFGVVSKCDDHHEKNKGTYFAEGGPSPP